MASSNEYGPEAFTLDDEDRKVNARISLYYVVVFILLGLPIWFTTTSSYRAALPEIQPIKQLRYDYEITILYCNPHVDSDVPKKVESLLQKFIGDSYSAEAICTDESSVCMFVNPVIVSKTCTSPEYSSLIASGKLSKFGSEMEALFGKLRPGALRVSVLPRDAFSDVPSDSQAVLSQAGELYLVESTNSHHAVASLIWSALRAHVLPRTERLQRLYDPNAAMEKPKAAGQLVSRDSGAMRPVQSAVNSGARFKLEFTLVGLRESEYRASWGAFQRYARAYLQPFRSELARIGVDLKLRSSVLHDVNLALNADERRNANPPFHVLRNGAQISALVNSLERYLTQFESDTSVNGERRAVRTLHFVVLLPPRRVSPLFFELPVGRFAPELNVPLNHSASVRIAKWGAIVTLNNADLTSATLSRATAQHVTSHALLQLGNDEMRLVFESALTHLRVLLGIQPDESPDSDSQHSVTLEPLDETSALRRFELGRWLAERTAHSYADAFNTLVALQNMLNRIQSMVIRDAVASRVHFSLQELDAAAAALQQHAQEDDDGRLTAPQVDAAFRSAQLALDFAEAAFFDETLLELLYFPEDQKFAIYVPLFLPVGLPVLLTLRDVLAFWKRRKEAKTKQ